jgi:hypothetical protein
MPCVGDIWNDESQVTIFNKAGKFATRLGAFRELNLAQVGGTVRL